MWLKHSCGVRECQGVVRRERVARLSLLVKHCRVWFKPETCRRPASALYVVVDACISRGPAGDPAYRIPQL